jgi:hypothetical protein
MTSPTMVAPVTLRCQRIEAGKHDILSVVRLFLDSFGLLTDQAGEEDLRERGGQHCDVTHPNDHHGDCDHPASIGLRDDVSIANGRNCRDRPHAPPSLAWLTATASFDAFGALRYSLPSGGDSL